MHQSVEILGNEKPMYLFIHLKQTSSPVKLTEISLKHQHQWLKTGLDIEKDPMKFVFLSLYNKVFKNYFKNGFKDYIKKFSIKQF